MNPSHSASPPETSPAQPVPSEPANEPTTSQVLFGMLIVWQLIFLLAANILGFFKHVRSVAEDGEALRAVDELAPGLAGERGHFYEFYRLFRRWEQLVNQDQYWRLFAPSVGDWDCFVFVELRWDDGEPSAPAGAGRPPPVIIRSPNEPEDLGRYVRWTDWRLRRYESFIALNLTPEEGETETQTRERLRASLRRASTREGDTMYAYLNWRWVGYREANPGVELPRQAILYSRCYRISAPDDPGKLIGPYVMPTARWLPHSTAAGRLPLQVYDPVRKQFVDRP
jgi:hypothetical protein